MTRRMFVTLALFAVFLSVWCHSHSNEPPHMKYSKSVNEKAQEEVSTGHIHSHDHHQHHHDHDHDHDHEHHFHGHEHGEHVHHHHDHDHHHSHEEEIHVHNHGHHHHQHSHETKTKFVPYAKDSVFAFLNDPKIRLWTYSIGATLLISAVPFLILMFIPIQANTQESSSLLKVLLAFGAGGLLGDAFLHLIPHASGGHDHGHGHDHHHHGEEGHDHVHDMSVGFWVLGGLLTFFIVEKFIRIVRGEDEHSHGHGHSHDQPFSKPNPPPAKKMKSSTEESDDEKSDHSVKKDKELKKRPVKKETVAERRASMSATAAAIEKKEESAPQIRVAAYLNLAADFLHNFTDGLAIGASFIAGSTVGIVTMWTVLFHEVPHEIGDFAILIQSGYSKRRAMFTQLLTAFGALAGCIISLWSVDAYALAEAAQSSWVLPFTAGGFIYIAAVSVLPELLEKSSFLLSVFEVIALGAGVFSMYLVALYE